jgi:hypothetical protein
MRIRPGAPCATVNAVRERVRPLTPDSAPKLGTPYIKAFQPLVEYPGFLPSRRLFATTIGAQPQMGIFLIF